MRRNFVTSRPGFFSRLANLRLVPAARERWSIEESATRVAEEPATLNVRQIQPTRGALIVAADLGHLADSLDAVAGSEFVDDRIRLRE